MVDGQASKDILNQYWWFLYIITVLYIHALGFAQVAVLDVASRSMVYTTHGSVIKMLTEETKDVKEDPMQWLLNLRRCS